GTGSSTRLHRHRPHPPPIPSIHPWTIGSPTRLAQLALSLSSESQ
ncbi:hypothetical protein JMJ77_0008314, partial [Colletotrichum scovillei]